MTWNGPKWVSSRYNFDAHVLKDFSFPKRIEICDMTLQGDGEMMPGVLFSRDERLNIARMLDEINVHCLNVGLITCSLPEEVEVVREIASLGLNAKVIATVEPARADLDLALKCDLSGISIELPSSDMWIRKVLMSSRRKIIDQAIESVSYAKEHGLNVAFYLQDAPRADPSFLKQFITVLSNQTKVDAIGLCDSWGIASPEGFRHLIREVRQWTELPIGTHCHNDFGLATANALAGLSAGAIMVTTTVNGIGERCGLTSLEEIAVALRVLYNIDVGIEYRRLCELSRVVEKATKIGISGLKPIVGQRAFAWEKETSIQALERLKAEGGLKAGLPYQPDFVGNNFKVFLGKRTGNRGIAWKASQLGFELTNQQTENALAAVKKSLRKQQPLTDQGFSKILTRILSVS